MSDPLSQSWLDLPVGTRFDLRGTTSVGRSPDNGLVLNDNQVSRRHALIQAQGEGEFWLVDLGSANGSYLNDRRVSQPMELKRGDVIELSGVRMTFGTEKIRADHSSASNPMTSTMLSRKTAKCWMMMMDIIGSTELAQQVSPEKWPCIMGNWFKDCRELIDAHGGQTMKYVEDGFFCYWLADEHSPAQVRATLISMRAIQRAASPPFRIVLHYGEAGLGSVPTVTDVNLHGHEVNFTFHIERLAGSFRQAVMLSEAAGAELGLPIQFVAKAKVDEFPGSFSFYAPVA